MVNGLQTEGAEKASVARPRVKDKGFFYFMYFFFYKKQIIVRSKTR